MTEYLVEAEDLCHLGVEAVGDPYPQEVEGLVDLCCQVEVVGVGDPCCQVEVVEVGDPCCQAEVVGEGDPCCQAEVVGVVVLCLQEAMVMVRGLWFLEEVGVEEEPYHPHAA